MITVVHLRTLDTITGGVAPARQTSCCLWRLSRVVRWTRLPCRWNTNTRRRTPQCAWFQSTHSAGLSTQCADSERIRYRFGSDREIGQLSRTLSLLFWASAQSSLRLSLSSSTNCFGKQWSFHLPKSTLWNYQPGERRLPSLAETSFAAAAVRLTIKLSAARTCWSVAVSLSSSLV